MIRVAELRERAVEEGLALGVVAAEALHVILLDALFAHPTSAMMAFQGGTCLHLVHGGYRYSEDLDLAGRELDESAARQIITRIRSEVEKLSVQVLGPGTGEWKPPSRSGRVCAYWFHFTPEQIGQRIRVKIEFAAFPTYGGAVLPVRSDLDLLRRRPLVNSLQPTELLAEKVAAVLGRPYLKGRDVFDLWFLDTVLQAPLDKELLEHKLHDYAVAPSTEQARRRIAALATADLQAEMERFLPQRHRSQLSREGYARMRSIAGGVVERAVQDVGLS